MKWLRLGLLALIVFLLLPLPKRSLEYSLPDCSKVDCREINIKQVTHKDYYPAIFSISTQIHNTIATGESFWHQTNDPDDSGVYNSEFIRNVVIALIIGVVFKWLIVPKSNRLKKWF
jgi:hypothetical protein